MRADYPVVLDACVLLPMPLADTLLRLAEHPRLYFPKWSDHIIGEVSRNLISDWGVSPEHAKYREEQLRKHFPEAWVTGYEPLIDKMTNDAKDRHVLAAAVRCGAEMIVSYDASGFAPAALQAWGIERQGPSTFLRILYDIDPELVVDKLHNQAYEIGLPIDQLLAALRKNVPAFVSFLCEEQGI